MISSSQGLYLYINTEKRTHKQQTSMPCVGFGPTIAASEQAKIVHALDRSAIVTGKHRNCFYLFTFICINIAEEGLPLQDGDMKLILLLYGRVKNDYAYRPMSNRGIYRITI
jgi:hypothetical protein